MALPRYSHGCLLLKQPVKARKSAQRCGNHKFTISKGKSIRNFISWRFSIRVTLSASVLTTSNGHFSFLLYFSLIVNMIPQRPSRLLAMNRSFTFWTIVEKVEVCFQNAPFWARMIWCFVPKLHIYPNSKDVVDPDDKAWAKVGRKHFFMFERLMLLKKMRIFVFFIRGCVGKNVLTSSNAFFFEIWRSLLWFIMFPHNCARLLAIIYFVSCQKLKLKFHKLFCSTPKIKVIFSQIAILERRG